MKYKVFVLPDAKKNLRKRFSKKHVVSQARKCVELSSDDSDKDNMLVIAGKFGRDPFFPAMFILFDQRSILVATKIDMSMVARKTGDSSIMDIVEKSVRMIGEIN